jgi:orotate phosphoribosyltransferase
MSDVVLERVLEEIGALRSGHFLLASGRHSDQYVEKFELLRRPWLVEAVCAELIRRLPWSPVDVVAGPTTGGILLAYEVARQLGVPAAYAERADTGSLRRVFRRGTTFPAGARVLVVDDILTTGRSVRETLAALGIYPVVTLGVAVLVDRSTSPVNLGVPLVALARLDIASWDATECPLCRAGTPLVKPGTSLPESRSS